VGKITTTGNHWFSDHEISSNIRLQRAIQFDPANFGQISTGLCQSLRSTDAIYHPEYSSERLILNFGPGAFPLRLYAGYDNDGNP